MFYYTVKPWLNKLLAPVRTVEAHVHIFDDKPRFRYRFPNIGLPALPLSLKFFSLLSYFNKGKLPLFYKLHDSEKSVMVDLLY